MCIMNEQPFGSSKVRNQKSMKLKWNFSFISCDDGKWEITISNISVLGYEKLHDEQQ